MLVIGCIPSTYIHTHARTHTHTHTPHHTHTCTHGKKGKADIKNNFGGLNFTSCGGIFFGRDN